LLKEARAHPAGIELFLCHPCHRRQKGGGVTWGEMESGPRWAYRGEEGEQTGKGKRGWKKKKPAYSFEKSCRRSAYERLNKVNLVKRRDGYHEHDEERSIG